MILKDDHRATVKLDGGLIIKTFKPGWELNTHQFDDKWKYTCNQFSETYGHFPRIIECTANKLVMERVVGEPLNELRDNMLKTSIDEQVKFIKKLQYMYFRFISNLLEYNVKYNVLLAHQDLNFSNMFIHNDKIICIDLDSTTVDRNPCEHSFITLPIYLLQHTVDNLNFQYYRKKEEQAAKINREHRSTIAKLSNIAKGQK